MTFTLKWVIFQSQQNFKYRNPRVRKPFWTQNLDLNELAMKSISRTFLFEQYSLGRTIRGDF
jgi:hypothetical protein